MKHELTTLNTKKALAASLKKYMAQKPLSKVTISEIITDCDVNRKTFYYHFEDIYALLKWMLEQEAVSVVEKFDLLTNYREAILFVMDYVEANTHILNCAYDSMGRDEMKRFFYADFIGIIEALVSSVEKEMGASAPDDFKEFLCSLYTEALAGVLIDWFRDPEKRDREKTLNYLSVILHTSLPAVLIEASKSCR